MYCKKCYEYLPEDAKFCPCCGTEIKNIVITEAERPALSSNTIGIIIASILDFIITIVVRFNVHEKTDLTPSALVGHYGMVVPSNIKLFVLAIPTLFSLITIIYTVMHSKMSKKEKVVSYIVSVFFLIASIAVVNLKIEL